MQIQENISLRQYNTFGIEAMARYFAVFTSKEELREAIRVKSNDSNFTFILGGGSNLLFTKDVDGLVLKNEITGIEVVKEDEEFVYVRAGAGVNWHSFVMDCVQKNLGGVENLSLIPGNIGASPMQNIGAYGVEIKDVFYSLEALHLYDGAIVTFSNKDCEFGYRESVFKQKYKNQFVILKVTYQLRKQPQFNTSYGAINQELEQMGIKELSIRQISQAVMNIRSSKLPDPKTIGNAGSFFKNPEVSAAKFQSLQKEFPSVVGYPVPGGAVKLAAGWLIEQCGWKGYRRGDAGCHEKQALVLVNYGDAKGKEIYNLSEEILQSVQEKFGVKLEREVNII
jgi:UDP-N-acetylmuramate dehydrogenase